VHTPLCTSVARTLLPGVLLSSARRSAAPALHPNESLLKAHARREGRSSSPRRWNLWPSSLTRTKPPTSASESPLATRAQQLPELRPPLCSGGRLGASRRGAASSSCAPALRACLLAPVQQQQPAAGCGRVIHMGCSSASLLPQDQGCIHARTCSRG